MKSVRILLKLLLFLSLLFFIILLLPLLNLNEVYTHEEAKLLASGKFVKLLGRDVHYQELGKGKPIIFIHGYLYNSHSWQNQIDEFAKKYRVLALDLFGFGYSERLIENEYSFKKYNDQVVHFMDVMTIEKAILVGHSMGAAVALQVAVSQPDRVNQLVLVAPVILPYKISPASQFFRRPLVGEFINALPTSSLIRKNIQKNWFYNKALVTDAYFRYIQQPLRIKGSSSSDLYILRNLLKAPLLQESAEKMRQQQILIVHGRDDSSVPLHSSVKLKKLWPNAQLEIFEKAKHNLHEEYPKKFNALVSKFLKNNRHKKKKQQ